MNNSRSNKTLIPPVKLKVCGMGMARNIVEIATLIPDYLGFIFYKGSPRNFLNTIPDISEKIIKTGVFVKSSENFIIKKIQEYNLRAIQLHGGEDAAYCRNLKLIMKARGLNPIPEIIKVFSVKNDFDFKVLEEFEEIADYFLFDTAGKNKGGNGLPFNWDILKDYSSPKPFFLSGGIDIDAIYDIQLLMNFFESKGKGNLFYGVDVNSKFEITPGHKDISKLEKFNHELRRIEKKDDFSNNK